MWDAKMHPTFLNIKEKIMGLIVDTERKYRPRTLVDFVYANDEIKDVVSSYGSGNMTRPLILSGTNGTGKSLLAELIPKAIEGFTPSVNRVRSSDLNSNKEIYSQFTRNKQFDVLFTVNNQRYNYNVIEEVNFDPKSSDAFRVVLDDYRGVDLTIMTSNEVGKIDVGIRSRCEILVVPPCEPHVFHSRAKAIIETEGYSIDEEELLSALEAVYEIKADNRLYYQKLDEMLRKA
jgi:DNA polymerase III delta prime subunit